MLDNEGGVDLAVAARVRCAWKMFRELSPFLTQKRALYERDSICKLCEESLHDLLGK
jgi:hypothetical protein